jgi:hypothetical protein
VALGYVADLSDDQLRTLRVAVSGSNSSSLVDPNTYGSAGFVIGIAALAIIVEILFVIVRICNIGLLNLKIKIFLIIVSITDRSPIFTILYTKYLEGLDEAHS